MQRLHFVLFGDSLTERGFERGGWGAGLTDLYRRKADITIRGFGGYNTRCALQIARDIFPQQAAHPAELVTLWFGANDAALPGRLGSFQHVPVSEYVENLQKLIGLIREYGAANIVLVTPPPVSEQARVQFNQQRHGKIDAAKDPERTTEHAGLYAEACRQVAKEAGLPVLDVWTALQEYVSWQSTFFVDGLHFNPDGNQAVLKLLLELIASQLPKLKADSLLTDYPIMENLDFDKIDESFAKHASLHLK